MKMQVNRETQTKAPLSPQERQRRMDEIPLGFCERLNVVNGFVTEIVAGHVKRIGREA